MIYKQMHELEIKHDIYQAKDQNRQDTRWYEIRENRVQSVLVDTRIDMKLKAHEEAVGGRPAAADGERADGGRTAAGQQGDWGKCHRDGLCRLVKRMTPRCRTSQSM